MSWRIDLPITKPLSLNDREHWAVKAKRVREVREAVATLARAEGIPQLKMPRVTLFYSPRDKRRRDALNLAATLKACEDGLVQVGVLVDDNALDFTSTMPVICDPNGERGRLWLLIEAPCRRCGTEGKTDDDNLTCIRCKGRGWE